MNRKKGTKIMEIREAVSSKEVMRNNTKELRDRFLIQNMFIEDKVNMIYSHVDRIIIGTAVPLGDLTLSGSEELRAQYFCERREMGVINLGGAGVITADGKEYHLGTREAMYIGMGTKTIVFSSNNDKNPAKFYFNSAPAHKKYPNVLIRPEGSPDENCVIVKPENKVELGSLEEANERVICKYILPGQVESCQLVMGLTELKPGSVWNTMPCHTHDRRMEVYLYCDLPKDGFVLHFMGEPQETRHIVVRNEEVVISPSWSIHSGCGTCAYAFVWGMVGENQTFSDMDAVAMEDVM